MFKMNTLSTSAAILILVASLSTETHAHMKMEYPNNGGADGDTEPAHKLCKGSMGILPTPLTAGSMLNVKLGGTIHHDGGGCQFGLSYDGGKNDTFTLIWTTDASCPIKTEWSVPIPDNAPSCSDCVFAWGWIPRNSGGPEYYMNCAKVQIKGSNGGKLSGPKMQFFNMLDYPSVHADGVNGAYTNGLTYRFGEGAGGKGVGSANNNAASGASSSDATSQSVILKRIKKQAPSQTNTETSPSVSPIVNSANTDKDMTSVTNVSGGADDSQNASDDKGKSVTPPSTNDGTVTNIPNFGGSPPVDAAVGSSTLSSVYGDVRGVSDQELLQRAVTYQQRANAEHQKLQQSQMDAQIQALNNLISSAKTGI
jgi:hypothetical protein